MNPAEFDTLARSEQQLWWFRGMQRILFRILDPLQQHSPMRRVMEAGSGTGYMASLLHQRYGWDMYVAELAWEGVSKTPRHSALAPVQADISACPYADQSFDAVICLDVLVHFPQGHESRALKEFLRVLKPGGLLVLRVSALDILRSRHSQFAHERQRFTRSRLCRTLQDLGFQILRSTYANSLLMPVALARFRIWEPLLRKPPASGTAPVAPWLDNLLFVPLFLEEKWIGKGGTFPAGQSLLVIAQKAPPTGVD